MELYCRLCRDALLIYNIARVGSQSLHRGREGVGEEEPRSDASSQVESEVSDDKRRKTGDV
jgi:hypothetical protein